MFWKWVKTFEKLHFVSFALKLCFYLTHSGGEYFGKLTFKRNKKRNFKRLYLKILDELRVKTNIFKNFIQFSLKQGVSLHALLTWVNNRGIHPLQLPVSLPMVFLSQTVNDELVKVLNFLFFIYFFCKWAETFKNLHFSLLDLSNVFTSPIQPRNILRNWHIRETKKANLNGFISKTNTNSQSKATYSESSFSFL